MSGHFLTRSTWRGFRRPDFPAGSWAVEGDVLHALPGGEPVSLVSRQPFGDFDLSLEWRLPKGGNSGIFYHVTEQDDDLWRSAPEMQLVHDAGHPDGRVPETSCGALYGLKAPHKKASCPPGLFNIARITVRGSEVEHWLNGLCVMACDLSSADFRKRVARSKFRDLPHFARAPDGLVALQHHGSEAWFRNVRIEVPGVSPSESTGTCQLPNPSSGGRPER
jgi:Domain of Unknown Function (DUF1080)